MWACGHSVRYLIKRLNDHSMSLSAGTISIKTLRKMKRFSFTFYKL